MHNIRIVDSKHGNQKIDNLFFNQFEKGQLKAQICESCGNVDLSVSNPHELWGVYIKSKAL